MLPLQTLTLKTKNEALKIGSRALAPTRAEITTPPWSESHRNEAISGGTGRRHEDEPHLIDQKQGRTKTFLLNLHCPLISYILLFHQKNIGTKSNL
jgi:hypothetical protein